MLDLCRLFLAKIPWAGNLGMKQPGAVTGEAFDYLPNF